jgi:hypothetical protein
MENSRNKAILYGVAEAFLETVLKFCEHPTLQFQWTRYIPSNVSEPFWKKLVGRIDALLKANPVLRGRSKGSLRRIDQLKIIPDLFKDKYGDPLVPDLPEEMYLASEYHLGDRLPLKDLGLRPMDIQHIVTRFQADLNSSNSRLKSPKTDEDWHTRAASVLLFPRENEWRSFDTVGRLPLIPLQSHEWVAITEGSIFFPHTDGVQIPSDLGLRIVDDDSIKNSMRKKLFVELGVASANASNVRNLILKKYDDTYYKAIDLESSVNTFTICTRPTL